ncbi:NAD(P)/FAD-dependent oxidoreductase [Mesorhizobium sp. ES1-1]|uniref:NAD(P)/FAD-dependent oxidoreductase n=1 Tax=Mesorhizobium sp. ES1-1 TaxID=2876629 RepID=UPI001CCC4052|nr:FAD-dependent oxidoreductase [Mesorhizobium sp. ES1-1]MBZ9677038.1 FAD-dependent oxidoreductase [Mesorhizobium sp. ES1-1]
MQRDKMNIVPINRGGEGGRKKIAVIGSGVSGAAAAWALHPTADVTLFEASDRAGGHTATVDIDYDGTPISVDTGFIVYNELAYPNLCALFSHLGVATHESDMGFSLSLDGGKLEWCGSTLRTIFAQKRNVFSPGFLWMLREILRFNKECVVDRDSGSLGHTTIGDYLDKKGYSPAFRDNYLMPMAAAIWSTPRAKMLDYPAASFISFFENHRLIHGERPTWRTVSGGSRNYLHRLLAPLGTRVRLSTPVKTIVRDAFGITVWAGDQPSDRFDNVIIATHSDQALAMLGDASSVEETILSAIPYRPNRVVLHRDTRLMPKRRAAWAAWNYLRSSHDLNEPEVSVTYWMNKLQGIDAAKPLFVSLNPVVEPRKDLVFGEWSFDHPQYDARALSAQARLDDIQGVRGTYFAGAWTGHGFHEDGLRSGLAAAVAFGAKVPWHAASSEFPERALAAE